MSKGTPSFGRHNKTSHIRCRRCGQHTYHITKKRCSHCGFPDAKTRSFRWQWKHPLTLARKR